MLDVPYAELETIVPVIGIFSCKSVLVETISSSRKVLKVVAI
jgi:hypothetical protein